MNLLPEDKLVWSPVVANSRMNRERNVSGINSYEQEFQFKPQSFLEEKIRESGKASWLDICCGYGKALMQTAEHFQVRDLQEKIKLKGIDLIDNFPNRESIPSCIKFEAKSIMGFSTEDKYDLITCVHGLHYVGDKLRAIQSAVSFLNHSGLFIANLDLNNILINGTSSRLMMKKLFAQEGFSYNQKTKVLKRSGHTNICFNMKYLGADDTYGPNYTGQDSVTSYYEVE